jgi:hypothetical protein
MFLIVSDQFGRFQGNSVERVRNERVHDSHGFFGDSSFGVDLFQNFVNVDSERFNSSFGSLDYFLDLLLGWGGLLCWHFNNILINQLIYLNKIF